MKDCQGHKRPEQVLKLFLLNRHGFLGFGKEGVKVEEYSAIPNESIHFFQGLDYYFGRVDPLNQNFLHTVLRNFWDLLSLLPKMLAIVLVVFLPVFEILFQKSIFFIGDDVINCLFHLLEYAFIIRRNIQSQKLTLALHKLNA